MMLKRRILFLFVCYLFSLSALASKKTLQNIRFYQEGDVSYVEIEFDGPDILAEKFHLIDDKQIILDLKNVVSDNKELLRGMDASEFSGSVVYISPYKRPNFPNDLRIAVQLRDNARSVLEKEGNKIKLVIENRFGVFTKKDFFEDKVAKVKLSSKKNTRKQSVHVPKSSTVSDILENVTHSGRKKYVGKMISFDVRKIPVEELLKMISEASGFNIILGDDVKQVPPVTLSLRNIPWDQALDTVLKLSKLVASKNGNILIVKTLQKATDEERLAAQAKTLAVKKEPLVTKVFPISYAEIADMNKILREYSTEQRGKIAIDKRTNSIIVKDTFQNIEKMKRIIETLDTQTPQILIEAKIIEAKESYGKNFGLTGNGLKLGYDPISPKSSIGGGTGGDQGPGFIFSSASKTNFGEEEGSTLLGLNIGVFKRLLGLNLQLQLMESESKGKIISTPKVITQNNMPAKIESVETTSYATSTLQDGVLAREFEDVNATLSLKVTPQVTNEGSIAMNIELLKEGFSRSSLGEAAPPDKTARSVVTNVLVDNGSTIVIGGIYSYARTEGHSGVPILKDIPILGWLFRSAYNPIEDKNELIIFITPRIINQEEAGLVFERDKTKKS